MCQNLIGHFDSKHDTANAYPEATKCYKKVDTNEAASCLERAVNIFCEIGRLNMAARYYKEISEYYEADQKIDQAIAYYEKAAEFFQNEEVTTSANQFKDMRRLSKFMKI
ncbi:Alpha-soluble NSF attachment protein 2 [Raphanus sativus]|nr:Alpha-soluble NSF attachment protein 2 [Raphanus sativus]